MKSLRIHAPNNSWTIKVDDEEATRIITNFYAGRSFRVATTEGDPWGSVTKEMYFNPTMLVTIEVTDA